MPGPEGLKSLKIFYLEDAGRGKWIEQAEIVKRTFVDASVLQLGQIKTHGLLSSVIPPSQFCINHTDATHLLLFTFASKGSTKYVSTLVLLMYFKQAEILENLSLTAALQAGQGAQEQVAIQLFR